MSQGALSQAIPAVLNGISISARYIPCPYDAVNQANIEAAGFPNVIRATALAIAIKAPSEGEYAYVNRKLIP